MNDHDASFCPNVPCNEYVGSENEHVNLVANNNVGSRFDAQKKFGNRNYHNQMNYDNYNQNGCYRNHGIQGNCGSYNNHSYNGQSHGQGYGNYNQGYGNHNHDSGQNKCRGVIENQAKLLDIYMTLSNEKFNDMLTCHKGLENQISQLANEFKEFTNLSSLTSQSLDLKSPMNAIVTRSGRVLKSEISKKSDAKDSPSNGQIENEGDENTLVEEVNKE
ncbi:uncharacterized protein DDB_G0280315-like [Chenopodium quinoa]|uniref:uncharacterized protein DDB_G0280315-like n=1 Tax=Chenopodium quinoa TaxID=63459 RepID=UPI000B777642|nr:uncharacterized protein DDB_G0280315-like [Chenopodium quinoa]